MGKTKGYTDEDGEWHGMTKAESKAHMEDIKLFMKHMEEKELCPKCGKTMLGLRASFDSNNDLEKSVLFCTNRDSGCWDGK